MTSFEHIRPYHDEEVNEALKELRQHPMIKALLHFSFLEKSAEEINTILDRCHSIRDFQTGVIYYAIKNVLDKSCEGFSTSGFENLDKNTPYLFISNHRDIILDTSLLNVALYENDLIMTASAIGDNLVHKPFLLALSKLNRNFLILREQTPRKMLESSKLVSNYMKQMLLQDQRSVWIAQREGRTKDGNDQTQQGVLKMLALASDEKQLMAYFKKLRVIPVSISYEFDPTDVLKMPELMAMHYDREYIKTNNEDFNSILKGALGQKKRIHIAAGSLHDHDFDAIERSGESANGQLQLLADRIDKEIHLNYMLWPSNYIAYDLFHETDRFKSKYTEKELRQFERRIERRVDKKHQAVLKNFLAMYANPVKNSLKYHES